MTFVREISGAVVPGTRSRYGLRLASRWVSGFLSGSVFLPFRMGRCLASSSPPAPRRLDAVPEGPLRPLSRSTLQLREKQAAPLRPTKLFVGVRAASCAAARDERCPAAFLFGGSRALIERASKRKLPAAPADVRCPETRSLTTSPQDSRPLPRYVLADGDAAAAARAPRVAGRGVAARGPLYSHARRQRAARVESGSWPRRGLPSSVHNS